jgi:hypothetical protein
VVGLSNPCGVGLSQHVNVCGGIVTVSDSVGQSVTVSKRGWPNHQGTRPCGVDEERPPCDNPQTVGVRRKAQAKVRKF